MRNNALKTGVFRYPERLGVTHSCEGWIDNAANTFIFFNQKGSKTKNS